VLPNDNVIEMTTQLFKVTSKLRDKTQLGTHSQIAILRHLTYRRWK